LIEAILGALVVVLLMNRSGAAASTAGNIPPSLAAAVNPAPVLFNGVPVGTVRLGGKPADAGWQPGNLAGKVTQDVGAAVGIAGALGVGSVAGFGSTIVGSAAAPGFAAAGTLVGSAIPLIGIGVAVVGTILGMISAHHKAALQREGQVLNSTDPAMLQALVLVAQAAIHGEITSVAQAKQHTDQIVADYYAQVRPIQRGTWPFAGDLAADYQTVWVQRTQRPGSDYHAPDPCNGACVVAHFFCERNAAIVLKTVGLILQGQHGVMDFPQIPAHATQQGFPEIQLTY